MANRLLTPLQVDSDNDNIVELEVKADKELYLKNSQVQSATAIAGSALVLNDALTGKLEFSKLSEAKVYHQGIAPIAPSENELWFNTNDSSLNFWDGSAWVNISPSPSVSKAYVEATINPVGQSLPITFSTKVIWNNIITDTQSCFNVLTNEFTAPRNGKYLFIILNRTSQISNTVGNLTMFGQLWKNGAVFIECATFSQYAPATGVNFGSRLLAVQELDLVSGDKIDYRIFPPSHWTTPSTISGPTLQRLTIMEL